MDTELKFYKKDVLLLGVRHVGEHSAEMEIDILNDRVQRGDGDKITIEAISEHGAKYVGRLRDRIISWARG